MYNIGYVNAIVVGCLHGVIGHHFVFDIMDDCLVRSDTLILEYTENKLSPVPTIHGSAYKLRW